MVVRAVSNGQVRAYLRPLVVNTDCLSPDWCCFVLFLRIQTLLREVWSLVFGRRYWQEHGDETVKAQNANWHNFCCLGFLKTRILLCRPDWPWTHGPPALTSQILRFWSYNITVSFEWYNQTTEYKTKWRELWWVEQQVPQVSYRHPVLTPELSPPAVCTYPRCRESGQPWYERHAWGPLVSLLVVSI